MVELLFRSLREQDNQWLHVPNTQRFTTRLHRKLIHVQLPLRSTARWMTQALIEEVRKRSKAESICWLSVLSISAMRKLTSALRR